MSRTTSVINAIERITAGRRVSPIDTAASWCINPSEAATDAANSPVDASSPPSSSSRAHSGK